MPIPALDLIVRLTGTIGTADTLEDIYEAALQGFADGFNVERASILLFDADGVMRFTAWRGLSDTYRDAVEGHTPWTHRQAAPDPILIEDAATDPSLGAYRSVLAREHIGALLFVPLVAERRVIGKFALYAEQPGAFDAREVATARALGYLIGFAVERAQRAAVARRIEAENARLLHEEAALRQRLTTLTDGSQPLLTATDRGEVVNEVLALAARLISADAYAVWRRDGDRWAVLGSRGELSRAFMATRSASHTTFQFTAPLVAADIGSVEVLSDRVAAYAAEGIVSFMAVPLAIRDEPGASITFYYRSRHVPSEAELRVAVALGHLSAAAISSAELYQEQQQLRREAEFAEARAAFLAEASARLSSLDYEGNLKAVAQLAVPQLADWCVVDLRDELGGLNRLIAVHQDPDMVAHAEELHHRYPADPSSATGAGRVLRTGVPELVAEITDDLLVRSAVDDEHLRILRRLHPRSAMVVPLGAGGRVFGVMTFCNATQLRCFDGADLQFASELGRRAAFAIENARLYQEARRVSRLKDEFLATLSHELRTPLNVIRGRARMLIEATDSTARHLAEAVDRNAETLGRLVDDLLDASRMTVGQVQLDRRAVDVRSVIEASAQAVQSAVQAKGIVMSLLIARDLPRLVGDPTRLQQIFWNLLTNAVKFTPPGGFIEIGAQQREEEFEIWVRDSGKGIAREELPHVFEMFWQSEPSNSRSHSGLGLGLSVVRKLVELHGGEVRAESDGPGAGTTFRVTLPHTAAVVSL